MNYFGGIYFGQLYPFSSTDRSVYISDVEGMLDIISSVQTITRSKTDSLSIVDAIDKQSQTIRSTTSTMGILDILHFETLMLVVLSDSIGIMDTDARTVFSTRSNIENIGLGDMLTPTLILNRSLVESLGLTDVLGREVVKVVNISDIMGLSDSLDKILRTIGKTVVRVEVVEDVRPIINSVVSAKPLSDTNNDIKAPKGSVARIPNNINEIDGIKPILYDVREA